MEQTKGVVVENERVSVLARQIETKVKKNSDVSTSASGVSFGKLLSTASFGEKIKLYLGWFFASLTGATLPLFFFFLGPIFDSFGPETDPKET